MDIGNLIFYIVLFILCIVLTRAIFSIPKIIRHLQAQTRLLAKIAEANGVDQIFIRDEMSKADNAKYSVVETE